MKNGDNNIFTSRWLRSFLLLALVYFSQIYPFSHLHHAHEDSLLEFGSSFFPVDVEVEHSSTHHHDDELPQTNNHQHTFDKHIDWHILRTQTIKTLSFDEQYCFSSIPFILTNGNNSVYYNYENTPFLDEQYVSSLIIRGPPLS